MADSLVCVDACLIARLFVGPDDARTWELFDTWTAQGTLICAPSLLVYELTDALYRYHRAGLLSQPTLQLVIDAMESLPLALEPHTTLVKPAVRLASTLGLGATYDAYYLALAERLDTELWTAAARLKQRVGDRGPRIRLVSEMTAPRRRP